MDLRRYVALFFLLISALAQPGIGSDAPPEEKVSTCRPEFAAEKKHTMCKVDNKRVVDHGVSDADKAVIVNYHNKVRREVQPPATDLTALSWDDRLAEVAEKWAMQCPGFHDSNRKIPSYGMSIGQNLAAGHSDWEKAMQLWYDEVSLFKYGQNATVYLGKKGWRKIGHYTQMVSNRTQRVGCGMARCGRTRYYICNYAQGQLRPIYPYTKGSVRCSKCEVSCKDGLCACNGKLCKNRGKLDINTCQCKCQPTYAGEDCGTLKCPEKDPGRCKRWSLDACKKFWDIPFKCPYMCGICE